LLKERRCHFTRATAKAAAEQLFEKTSRKPHVRRAGEGPHREWTQRSMVQQYFEKTQKFISPIGGDIPFAHTTAEVYDALTALAPLGNLTFHSG
jgi:hypothetical protein